MSNESKFIKAKKLIAAGEVKTVSEASRKVGMPISMYYYHNSKSKPKVVEYSGAAAKPRKKFIRTERLTMVVGSPREIAEFYKTLGV